MPQQQTRKVYADPAYKPGGRYGPRGDTYLDPGLDTSQMTPPDPLAGLRAAAAGNALPMPPALGPADVRVPGVPPMPYPQKPASAFGAGGLQMPGDPYDIEGMIEGEGLPTEEAEAGPPNVPGLSWRWGSKGAPSASQLAGQRDSFLATGASPEIALMADAAQGRRLVDENLRNRPDLLEARTNLARLQSAEANTPEGKAAERARLVAEQDKDLAMNGLWRAKAKAKAGMQEPIAKAEAFLDPTVSRARWMADMDPINIALSPGARQLRDETQRGKEALAGIGAASRAMMYGGDPNIFPGMEDEGMVGPAGGFAAGKGESPAPVQAMPQAVPAALVEKYAKENGLMFYQAQQAFEAQGIKVIVPKR